MIRSLTMIGLVGVVGVLFQNCAGTNAPAEKSSSSTTSAASPSPGLPFGTGGGSSVVPGTGNGLPSVTPTPTPTVAAAPAATLVTSLYRGLLKRNPSDGELSYWVNQNLSCVKYIVNVASSAEATDTIKYKVPYPNDADFATAFYTVVLKRAPEAGVIDNAIVPYLQNLEQAQTVAAARQQLIANMVTSAEVTQHACPQIWSM